MVDLTSQWLTFRSSLADWKTDRQNELDGRVSLENQPGGEAAHPLFMAERIFPLGLQPIGGSLVLDSRLRRAEEGFLLGTLVDDLGNPLYNEGGAVLLP